MSLTKIEIHEKGKILRIASYSMGIVSDVVVCLLSDHAPPPTREVLGSCFGLHVKNYHVAEVSGPRIP